MDGDAAVLACAVWAAVQARRAGGMEYVLTPTFGQCGVLCSSVLQSGIFVLQT